MITFKNIAGNKFLAVGTIQRKSALNGEKSLTGTLYDGKDVLNKIDKGWSLEFDGEPYVVTYFERNDNDNSVSFDAIHKFFWDMAKSVLYSETSGSHTIKWYLDQIFANTEYSYALNFNPNAIQKDNWGMKNKLSLFNDIISSIEGEFEINGTLISLFKNIGTDLSTIVRYGFNLSDMTLENDATSFVTYGEGFGEYADPENMTGDRLHVTYTSPLASVYGKLQAEPIDNRNYTIAENLLAAVKKQVDDSFSVSVNLSLYDLSVAGYPYKMANVGDWLTAVDENLDFKQRIRIISIDDDFAADGTRISYVVTAGNVGVTKRYQDANASLASKVEEAVVSSGQAVTDANIALIAANGKNKSYYLNSVDDLPQTANEGDLAWVQSGDGRVLYIYTKKADGTYYWEKRIDPEMGEQIEAGVNEAIAQANENTDKAIADNNTQINETINQVAKEQADLAIKDGDFNNKAQAMADEALANAKANTATVSQETLKTANENLDAAKKTLTTDLQKEISDRTLAVTALDTKAQGYANTAKTDALNTIAKEVTDRQNAVSALETKATNAVNQAKSDITDTINAISVGGRNYVLNYSGLSASVTSRPVVNGAASDVSAATITYDSDGITLTNPTANTDTEWYYELIKAWQDITKTPLVSGKQYTLALDVMGTAKQVALRWGSKEISPYQSFKAFDINNTDWTRVVWAFTLPVGTLNTYLRVHGAINSQYATGFSGGETLKFRYVKLESGNKATDPTPAPEDVVLDYTTKDNQIKATITQYQTTNDSKVTKAQTDATAALGLVATKVSQTDYDTKTGDLTTKYTQVKQTVDSQATDIVSIKATATSQASKINSISSDVDGTKQSISDIETTQDSQSDKINQITSDVNGTKQSITDIQTKDGQQDTRMGNIETSVSGVKSDFSTYKTDANGRISTAQTTAQTAVDGLKTKVSQSDYNAKTSELTTKVSTAQQTADSAVTTIGSYKTSNDNRVTAAETKISQNASDITLRATTSDLNAAKSDYTAQIAQVKVDAQAVTTTVSQIQTTVNKLNQNNLVNNSQLNPDYSGWHVTSPWGKSVTTELWNNGVESNTGAMWVWHDQSKSGEWIYSDPVAILPGISLSASVTAAMPNPPSSGTPLALYVYTYDANKTKIDSFVLNIGYSMVNGTFKKFNLDNKIVSSGAKYASIVFGWNVAGMISFGKPMLMFGKTTGDYVAGPYNNNDKVSTLRVSLDGITSTVSTNASDIKSVTSRVQTAEGTLSTATNDISGLQSKQTQTANQITQEISDRANGDNNTLQSSKDFTTSNIASAVTGLNSTIAQTASGIIAQVETQNMITNSEFDPLNYGWFSTSASVGSTVGGAWNPSLTTGFLDWPVAGGSRLVLYNVATWFTSELKTGSAGKTYSASIVAGRASVPAQSTALDLRIAFWDKNKALLATTSAGNIIDGAAYKGLTKYVVENKTAPTGTLFVSLLIAHSGAAIDIVGRPMLNVGSTAAPYTPTTATTSSSTILSLLKDNWSIGISDNIGNITSGIVGNSNSMSLISDNITLKGTTTVTGEFFARGGSFTNLNASNMTVGTLNGNQVNITNVNAANITGDTTNFIKSNWSAAYSNVSINPDNILLNAKSGSTTLTSVNIGSLGMKIEMPGTASFLSDTMINSGGISFHHAGGTYGSFGMLGNGFTTEYSPTGGSPLGITVGDGKNNDAANMAFGISVSQYAGQAPQLIWAGANTGKVSSSYRTWDNPAGFIIADNIKFSTWDNTASIVEFDSTITYRNWAPDQTYGYIDGNGTKRWFKVSGYTLNKTNKLVGIFGGDGANGIAFDQTGDVWFSNKGNTYSLHDMLAKLNML